MCQKGGKRCPSDTSEARMARRRAQKANGRLKESGAPTIGPVKSSNNKKTSTAGPSKTPNAIPPKKKVKSGRGGKSSGPSGKTKQKPATNKEIFDVNNIFDSIERELFVSKQRLERVKSIQEKLNKIRNSSHCTKKEATDTLPLVQEAGLIIAVEAERRANINSEKMHEKMLRDFALLDKKADDSAAKLASLFRKAAKDDRIDHEILMDRKDPIALVGRIVDSCEEYKSKGEEVISAILDYKKRDEAVRRNSEKMLNSLRDAYTEVISEMRDLGVGRNTFLKFHNFSSQDSVDTLVANLDFFPEEWIRRAVTKNLYVGESLLRAHHIKNRVISVDSEEPVISKNPDDLDAWAVGSTKIRTKEPKSGPKISGDMKYTGYLLKPGMNTHTRVLGALRRTRGADGASKYEDSDIWFDEALVEYVTVDIPQGKTLDDVESPKPSWNRTERANPDGSAVAVFYAPKMEYIKLTDSVSELKFIALLEDGSNKDEVKRSIAHEMCHIGENAMQKLSMFQQVFYDDRTGIDKEIRYHGHLEAEVLRKDNFVDIYMGREYYPGNDENVKGMERRHFELLAMGTEAVMGEYGGLIGFHPDYRESDNDMRNFILGLYGTI